MLLARFVETILNTLPRMALITEANAEPQRYASMSLDLSTNPRKAEAADPHVGVCVLLMVNL